MKKKFSTRVRPECRTLCGVSKDKKRRSLLLIFALFLSSSCFAADHAPEQRPFSQRALAIVRSEIGSNKKSLIAASLALLLRVYNLRYNPLNKDTAINPRDLIEILLISASTYKEIRDFQSSPSKLDFINKERILSFTFALLTTYLTYKSSDKRINYDIKAIHKFGIFIGDYLGTMSLQYIKRGCHFMLLVVQAMLGLSHTMLNVSHALQEADEADSANNYFLKFIFSSLIVFAISQPKNLDEINSALRGSVDLHYMINIIHMAKLLLIDGLFSEEFREIQNLILNFFNRGIRHEALPAVGRIDRTDNARNENLNNDDTTEDENPS